MIYMQIVSYPGGVNLCFFHLPVMRISKQIDPMIKMVYLTRKVILELFCPDFDILHCPFYPIRFFLIVNWDDVLNLGIDNPVGTMRLCPEIRCLL